MNSIRAIKSQRRVRGERLQRKVRSLFMETMAVPEDAPNDVALHPLLFGLNRVTGAEFEVLVKKNPAWEQYRHHFEQRDRGYDRTGRFIGKGM